MKKYLKVLLVIIAFSFVLMGIYNKTVSIITSRVLTTVMGTSGETHIGKTNIDNTLDFMNTTLQKLNTPYSNANDLDNARIVEHIYNSVSKNVKVFSAEHPEEYDMYYCILSLAFEIELYVKGDYEKTMFKDNTEEGIVLLLNTLNNEYQKLYGESNQNVQDLIDEFSQLNPVHNEL